MISEVKGYLGFKQKARSWSTKDQSDARQVGAATRPEHRKSRSYCSSDRLRKEISQESAGFCWVL